MQPTKQEFAMPLDIERGKEEKSDEAELPASDDAIGVGARKVEPDARPSHKIGKAVVIGFIQPSAAFLLHPPPHTAGSRTVRCLKILKN